MKNNMKSELSTATQTKLSNEMSLDEVAQEFESIFINQMLKSARSAKLADGLMDSEAYETYQSLLDQEYSKTLAKNHNFGIAEGLIRQFGNKVNR
ncbi:MAG: hypothetical protein CMN00_05290 [Rickettsiales bacterium]|nr:hypothetical protein [Rickettsiales bacterium]MAY90581.1 hypothetical protein [Rickettsiales bacterium]RPF76901.1 MAG: hypothetical protein CBE14_001730 [Rickettsiales bacterium TMED254]